MSEANLPEGAFEAARTALTSQPGALVLSDAGLRAALTGAAPHFVAAERDRIEGLFGTWIDILMQEPNSHPPEAWRAGFADLIRVPDAEA